jgi:Mg/Co/Ni transporter MgtE
VNGTNSTSSQVDVKAAHRRMAREFLVALAAGVAFALVLLVMLYVNTAWVTR